MIVLSENAGVKKVKQIHNQLRKELNENDVVEIDFSKVKRTDLALIQLILVTGRYANELNKVIKLRFVSDEVRKQMQICGLKI